MKRSLLFFAFFISLAIIFTIRLFYIQVIDPSYKLSAENNAKRTIKLYAPRGYIYDRNNTLLVANQVAYDLMIVPRQVSELDTSLLCELLDIDVDYFKRKYSQARSYSSYKPSVFYELMSNVRFARIQEELHRFPGFFIQKRLIRDYPRSSAANVLGFIGEVNTQFIDAHPEYSMGDLIGKAGIDKSYEEVLRGRRGIKYMLVDNHNRDKGAFMGGQYDTMPVPGSDLMATIDIALQEYGEKLMHGKRGSIVAIEPSTGEILAMISSPGYDPNLLVGRKRSKNYTTLYHDSINKPLYDRGLLAEYPPGSPFKLINALIGLQEGTLHENTTYTCHHGFHFGKLTVGCHCSGGPMQLRKSIEKSCNNYYCNVFKAIIEKYPNAQEGMDAWSRHVKSFGLGQFLNNDLATGRKGFVPNADYYNRSFGSKSWRAVSTISLAIGQGELVVTPIQLANVAAIIANRGFYFTPHIVKQINGEALTDTNYTKPKYTTVESQHYEIVIDGMYDVFESGTAAASKLPNLPMCGKTGTAENPHGQDHSIFLAFAPKDNPKIALAIIVENGYWGSRWAAPIASLMMESYITGQVTRPAMEQRMFDGVLYEEYAKQVREKYGTDTILKRNF